MFYNIVSCFIKLSPDSVFASAVGPNQLVRMKIFYRALPTPYLEVKAISSILSRASLAPCFLMGSDFPTIPASIRGMGARFTYGKADAPGNPGTGSELFEVNMWAMQFAPSPDNTLFERRRIGGLLCGSRPQLSAVRHCHVV